MRTTSISLRKVEQIGSEFVLTQVRVRENELLAIREECRIRRGRSWIQTPHTWKTLKIITK